MSSEFEAYKQMFRGMLYVCRTCLKVRNQEPAKCGRLPYCKSALAFGMALAREECARFADEVSARATEAEPCEETAEGASRAAHVAVSAGRIADGIRALNEHWPQAAAALLNLDVEADTTPEEAVSRALSPHVAENEEGHYEYVEQFIKDLADLGFAVVPVAPYTTEGGKSDHGSV